jgi:hypothetical protein
MRESRNGIRRQPLFGNQLTDAFDDRPTEIIRGEETFLVAIDPSVPMRTTSVNVPPMSAPTR